MTRSVAIVQARMSSSRFPGKVLEDLAGVPMVLFLLGRLSGAQCIDEIVLATSIETSDDELAEIVRSAGYQVFRGPLDDVLARFAMAAQAASADIVVRITGDCPLIDAETVDQLLVLRAKTQADYAWNIDPPTFPDGFDCEVFTFHALEKACRQARTKFDREHVTPWMRDPGNGLRLENLRCKHDLSHLRLTVDYPDDLAAVRQVVALAGPGASLDEILATLDANPEIIGLNQHARNEGSSVLLP